MAAAPITTRSVATRQAQVAGALAIPAIAVSPAIAEVLTASSGDLALLADAPSLVVIADVLTASSSDLALLADAPDLVVIADVLTASSGDLALHALVLLSVVSALLLFLGRISALPAAPLVLAVRALRAHTFLPRISILAVHAATGTFLVLLILRTCVAFFGSAWSCR